VSPAKKEVRLRLQNGRVSDLISKSFPRSFPMRPAEALAKVGAIEPNPARCVGPVQ